MHWLNKFEARMAATVAVLVVVVSHRYASVEQI